MTDNSNPRDPDVIPFRAGAIDDIRDPGLNRFARGIEREKIDEMWGRVERGEVSDEELELIKQDQTRRAFGLRRPSTDSLPPWIQPAVRKALDQP